MGSRKVGRCYTFKVMLSRRAPAAGEKSSAEFSLVSHKGLSEYRANRVVGLQRS